METLSATADALLHPIPNGGAQVSQRVPLLRGQGTRPLGIYVGGLLLLLLGIPQVLFLGLALFEALLDWLGPSELTFGNLSAAGFLVVSPVIAMAIASPIVLGFGLLSGRRWARPLGAYLWFGLGIMNSGIGLIAGPDEFFPGHALLGGSVLTGFAYWYLYVKESVRKYYCRLERSS